MCTGWGSGSNPCIFGLQRSNITQTMLWTCTLFVFHVHNLRQALLNASLAKKKSCTQKIVISMLYACRYLGKPFLHHALYSEAGVVVVCLRCLHTQLTLQLWSSVLSRSHICRQLWQASGISLILCTRAAAEVAFQYEVWGSFLFSFLPQSKQHFASPVPSHGCRIEMLRKLTARFVLYSIFVARKHVLLFESHSVYVAAFDSDCWDAKRKQQVLPKELSHFERFWVERNGAQKNWPQRANTTSTCYANEVLSGCWPHHWKLLDSAEAMWQ